MSPGGQSMGKARLPLALTMGDPAGIGPEIVARLAATLASNSVHGPGARRILVIGDVGVFRRTLAGCGLPLDSRAIAREEIGTDERLDLVDVLETGAPLPADLPIGRESALGGRASHDWVVAGARLALDGRIAGMVTAPINKAAWSLAGIDTPGHTELLAEIAGVDDFGMMLANDDLRVMLVSIHVPLARAVTLVTRASVLKAIRLADRGARELGVICPRVAVAGLNPHAGEGGLFGREDLDIIAPAIADACALGLEATGPWPPDTVFMRARQGEFDVVVAQYHDQGLIPVKYLGLHQGVNITVGLPFIRTSVDHGTAYDIAGRGMADPGSLAYAVAAARRMIEVRRPA